MSEAAWLEIAKFWGPMGVALVFLGFCFWRGGRWIGSQVVIPMRNRHLDFIDVMSHCEERNTISLAKLSELPAQIKRLDDKLNQHDAWEKERAAVLESKLDIVLTRIETDRNGAT